MLACYTTGNNMFLKSHSFFIKLPQFALLLGFFLICNSSVVVAQQAQVSEKVTHGLGFSGGFILGTGLTYVHYLGPHMLQVSFIGDVDEYKTDFKTGFSYARYIHHVNAPRSLLPVALKFIAGVDIHYQDGLIETDVINNDEFINIEEDKTYFFHTGAGLGIDIGNPGKPGLVGSLILTYALSLEEVNKKREWEISILPAAGILYSW